MEMSQTLIKLANQSKTHKSANRQIVRDSNLYTIGTFMSFILCLFIGSSIYSPVHATDSSITVTISDPTVDLNVSPSTYGTFAKSAVTNIGVATTNYTGYTLKLSASNGSNPTALVNGSDSTNTLSSITSSITEEQFKALDSTSYNNRWGYLVNKTGESSTTFLPSPTTAGTTLDTTTAANTDANTYALTIGARVDTSMKLGAYTNTFVLYATTNPIPYTIIFDDNVVANMPTDISAETLNNTITLPSNIPTRDGYTFQGWCTVTPTATNGVDACTGGTQYSASGSIPIDQTGGSNNYHLYSMWSKSVKTIANSTYLQEVNSCPTSVPTETTYTLKDSRDQQDYTVAKLKDGQCWMTKNLNLAGGTTLTADNTDMDASWTLPVANGFQSNNRLPVSSTSGFSDNTIAYLYNSNSTTCNSTSPCFSYYTWTTATLGSGLSITTDGIDAPYSICPKGWRLPTSRGVLSEVGNSDLWHLAVAYGMSYNVLNESTTNIYDNAGPGTVPNLMLVGSYRDSEFNRGGSRGEFWSSTSTSAISARNFALQTNYTTTYPGSNRKNGWGVRCILR